MRRSPLHTVPWRPPFKPGIPLIASRYCAFPVNRASALGRGRDTARRYDVRLSRGRREFIMRHAPLAVVPFVVALTMLPAPAAAQDWSQPWADPEDRPPRVDFSASGGFLMPTRWSDLVLLGSPSPAVGVLEQVLTRDIHVKPDTEFTAAATYW